MIGTGPFGNGHFTVEIDHGTVTDPPIGTGFSEVMIPDFAIDQPAALVLRRAVTGRRDLYAWWDKARSITDARRDVRVRLITGDWSAVVMIIHFVGARPTAFGLTALAANAPSIMMETITVAFDRVEISYPGDPVPIPADDLHGGRNLLRPG